ncbi:alternative NAD(P)H-ubiquinone oxidoreductase C1, chloroplastic/mitochondrial isoform X2 [Ricinus communis]|uniref:alternative NAD(P)H-ubiquinone oxidoreductase C1, chloroplastic/mitochondrial isoform X2 n=1 Tax=Ricinus communis TaxID=3988 RepID=UPI00077233A8|nr:alternative NAD(P)H-ubiquinone oxidoreductase C1, chloroplastic/mitochondrial isoform X2 [Ricinus communis]|eukprot:XP_015580162.1 alternative NAD(P)H-ubiquinone oxidoreductase C1, chloroplastic/mitochondrial isoform X2 [Ricinus communis]
MAIMALSCTATLVPVNRIANRVHKLFPTAPKSSIRCQLFSNRGFRLVGCSAIGGNQGVAEISQSETRPRIYTWPDNKKPRVCILGGGFGGLYTALRLESLVWADDKKPQVLLVDQSAHFVFKPMLYELLSGEVDAWEIAPRFSDLLANTGVLFLQDKVKLLQPSDHLGKNGSSGSSCGGTVLLASGLLIEYDWLVLALGAEARLDVVPGAAKCAFPFSTLEDACRVNHKLNALERRNFGKDSLIRVAVVGCGYSGVELAATISERLKERGVIQAINIDTNICPAAPPGNREAALRIANDLETSAMSAEVDASENIASEHSSEKYFLELQPAERGLQSQILEADLVLWTVGSKPLLSQLESDYQSRELPLNARGQAETDETLRVKGHPRIFALGDSSALRDSSGRLLPATAQVAFQQADFAGWNLWAAINDRPLLPFRFQNLGEMMTLGRNDAALSPSFIEGLTLEGPIGHAARKLAYLIRLPTDEHRLKVGISWLTKSAIDSVASMQSTLAKVLSGP